MGEAYSSLGRTSVLLAVSLTSGSFIFMFLLRKPSVLFAFPVILSVWEFQDRPEEMSTPKYLALVTASRTCPCR